MISKINVERGPSICYECSVFMSQDADPHQQPCNKHIIYDFVIVINNYRTDRVIKVILCDVLHVLQTHIIQCCFFVLFEALCLSCPFPSYLMLTLKGHGKACVLLG